MNIRTMTVDIEVNGFSIPDCHVTYTIFGKHYPQTETSPEEWPEIEIEGLYINGVNTDTSNIILDVDGVAEDLIDQVQSSLDEEGE